MAEHLHNNQQFINELQHCARQLSSKLSSDDMVGASMLIEQLVEIRDRNIFNAVGKLTRGLHDAIVNFHVDGNLKVDPPEVASSQIQDASERLNYVIEMTRTAANKTMDVVESSSPIARDLGERADQFQQQWSRLQTREMSAAEFRDLYHQTADFFQDIQSGALQLNKNMQDIILEQGYQDLSGQIIKRVIGLVVDVEQNLVELMRIAGRVEEITGLADRADKSPDEHREESDVQPEGPQIHAKQRAGAVSGQDEVDDLLSSLGF